MRQDRFSNFTEFLFLLFLSSFQNCDSLHSAIFGGSTLLSHRLSFLFISVVPILLNFYSTVSQYETLSQKEVTERLVLRVHKSCTAPVSLVLLTVDLALTCFCNEQNSSPFQLLFANWPAIFSISVGYFRVFLFSGLSDTAPWLPSTSSPGIFTIQVLSYFTSSTIDHVDQSFSEISPSWFLG